MQNKNYFNTIFLKYQILKYIFIYYKNDLNLNHIFFKVLDNKIIIYIVSHTKFKNSYYNLKKLKYLEKNLQYLNEKYKIKLYILNIYLPLLFKKKISKKGKLSLHRTKRLKKIQKLFNNYKKIVKNKKKIKQYKLLFFFFLFSLYFKNFKYLNNFLIFILKKTKKHFQILKNLKFFFKYFYVINKNLRGIKIEIKGRLNGALRSKKYKMVFGNLYKQSFDSKIFFHKAQAKTSYGTCGIKLWVSMY